MSSSEHADAFPTLSSADLSLVEAHATRRVINVGDYLFRQGDQTNDFFVVLSGAVEIIVHSDNQDRVIVEHGPGRFTGDLNLLTGLRLLVSARVAEAGEVAVLSRQDWRTLIATNPRLGDTILTALMARRALLLQSAASSIRLVGSRFSPETRRIREYLSRSHIPHEWLDPDRDTSVEELLQASGTGPGELPVVLTGDTILRQVTAGSLAEYLGLTVQNLPGRSFDLVVAGGGPAGLAAAVYGASEGLRTLIVDMVAAGGQAGSSSRIENYLGFPTGISGDELTMRALVQAEKFGAFLSSPCAATALREENGHLVVRLSDGADVVGRAVIAATGAKYRRLDVDRLEYFEGNGVYYAATELESRLCAGSPLVVVGGGNSAGQAAMFLADTGSSVALLIRGSDLGKNMSRYLVDRVEAHPNINVHMNCQVTGLEGDASLEAVRVTGPDGEVVLACGGLFSLIGADPSSEWISRCAALDEHGFVLTDMSLNEEHLDGTAWTALRRRPLPFVQKIFFTLTNASQAAGQAFILRLLLRTQDRDHVSGPEVASAQIAAFRDWEQVTADRFADLERIAHPTLVVNGVHDEMIPVRNSYWLAEHLPNAVLLVYPDAGHGSLFQWHESFANQAAQFLASDSQVAPY